MQHRAATHITAFVRGCQHRCFVKQYRAANTIQGFALKILSRKKRTFLEKFTPHLLLRLLCDNTFEDNLLGGSSGTFDAHAALLEKIAADVSLRGSKRKTATRWHAPRNRKKARVSNELRGFVVDDHHCHDETKMEEPRASWNYDQSDTDVSEYWSEDESEEEDTASDDDDHAEPTSVRVAI